MNVMGRFTLKIKRKVLIISLMMIALISVAFLLSYFVLSHKKEKSLSDKEVCYKVKFSILTKGQSLVPSSETSMMENISTGILTLYKNYSKITDNHNFRIGENQNYIRVNGVVQFEYKMEDFVQIIIQPDQNISFEYKDSGKNIIPEKKSIQLNALKQLVAHLTLPQKSLRRKEFFGEVDYLVQANKKDRSFRIIKSGYKLPFNLNGSYLLIPGYKLEGEEKMVLYDHLESTTNVTMNWVKQNLSHCDEIRTNALNNAKKIKADLSYDFDYKAIHLSNMRKKIENKNIATFFQNIKLDDKGLLTNEDFLTLRAFIEINKKEALDYITDQLKKMSPDSEMFRAMLVVLAKPVIPEVQDSIVDLSKYYQSNDQMSVFERVMQLLIQENNPNENTMEFLKEQNSDMGLLVKGAISRSALSEAPEKSRILVEDLLKMHETMKKDNPDRLNTVEDALGNAGASELLGLVDTNTPEGLSNLRFVKEKAALDLLVATLTGNAGNEKNPANRDAALSALELRMSYGIDNELVKLEVKKEIEKFLNSLEPQNAEEEMFRRRALLLVNPNR